MVALRAASLVLALTCSLSGGVRGQCLYDITVVHGPTDPVFGQASAKATSINDAGNVVGPYSFIDPIAYRWTAETGIQPLPLPVGALCSEAWDVNSAGRIIGEFERAGGPSPVAIVWDGEQFTEVPPPAGSFSQPHAVNDGGIVVGTTADGTSFYKAFVWDGKEMTLIQPLFGPRSSARDINSAGQITGWMGTGPLVDARPFLWQEGRIAELGLPPGAITGVPIAINDAGDVVGALGIADGEGGLVTRSVLWSSDGQVINLGVLPGFDLCSALDVAGAGQIIGNCQQLKPPYATTGFLWQNGAMFDLNTLIAPNAGAYVAFPNKFNDLGQIAASVWLTFNGRPVGLMLTPTDQPLGDLNFDCRVDHEDLAALLTEWGNAASSADLNSDGIVNVVDFLLILANWSETKQTFEGTFRDQVSASKGPKPCPSHCSSLSFP